MNFMKRRGKVSASSRLWGIDTLLNYAGTNRNHQEHIPVAMLHVVSEKTVQSEFILHCTQAPLLPQSGSVVG